MFNLWYKKAREFVFPIIINILFFDDTTKSLPWTVIAINNEWWFMTVSHNFEVCSLYKEHKKEIESYEKKIKEIDWIKKISKLWRERKLKKIKYNPKWIKKFGILIGKKNTVIEKIIPYNKHDLALFKINKKEVGLIKDFPKIKEIKTIKHGKSLCKLWFPFSNIGVKFNEEKKQFIWEQYSLTLFPIEWIYTRNIIVGYDSKLECDIKFLETSSAWIKWQSWWPIFDINWNIYAIQSKNQTLPLDFIWEKKDWEKITTHEQFINLWIWIHSDTIIKALKKNYINFQLI
jgi:hypothetical protein